MPDDQFPVQWMGQRAIVAFPGQVDASNVDRLRDRLLSVINRGAGVVVADMTGTLSCDHAAVDAIARACQRAAVSGAQLRLVVTAPVIRRVLGIEGLDRLVSIYPSLEAAEAAGPLVTPPLSLDGPPGSLAGDPAAEAITPAVLWQIIDAPDDGLALTGEGGTIALVNRRCAEMFGYQREELIGLPVDALVPPDVQAAHRSPRTCWTASSTSCSRSGSACRVRRASQPRWPAIVSAPRWTNWTRRSTRSATTRSAAAKDRSPRARAGWSPRAAARSRHRWRRAGR